jgi:hypothetical protein
MKNFLKLIFGLRFIRKAGIRKKIKNDARTVYKIMK